MLSSRGLLSSMVPNMIRLDFLTSAGKSEVPTKRPWEVPAEPGAVGGGGGSGVGRGVDGN